MLITISAVFLSGHGKLDLIKAYQILSNYKPQARYVFFSVFELHIRICVHLCDLAFTALL